MITKECSEREVENWCKSFGNSHSGKMRWIKRRSGLKNINWLVAIILIVIGGISECSSLPEEGGYFLFTPPFGGDKPPKEVVASRRSGGDSNDVRFKRR